MIDFYAPNLDLIIGTILLYAPAALTILHIKHKRRTRTRERARLERLKKGCMRCY